MPTFAYYSRSAMKPKKKTDPTKRQRTGPHGERRPMSPTSNMVRVMEIATGLREEEYADGTTGPHARRGDD